MKTKGLRSSIWRCCRWRPRCVSTRRENSAGVVFGKSSIIERVARGWLSVVGASQCVNRGRQQAAVSGEQSGRSDLLKRQTDGGYPSCVQRTRQGDAGEVELGCYELCDCTKGRQCESTVALCRRDLWPFVRFGQWTLCMGLDQQHGPSVWLPNTVFWLWRLSLSTSFFVGRSDSDRHGRSDAAMAVGWDKRSEGPPNATTQLVCRHSRCSLVTPYGYCGKKWK